MPTGFWFGHACRQGCIPPLPASSLTHLVGPSWTVAATPHTDGHSSLSITISVTFWLPCMTTRHLTYLFIVADSWPHLGKGCSFKLSRLHGWTLVFTIPTVPLCQWLERSCTGGCLDTLLFVLLTAPVPWIDRSSPVRLSRVLLHRGRQTLSCCYPTNCSIWRTRAARW